MTYYARKWKGLYSLLFFLTIALATAAAQVILALELRTLYQENIVWPSNLFGILPNVLTLIGFVPQFLELYRDRNPDGLSLLFLSFDICGAILSLLSLAFHENWDWIAAMVYIMVGGFDIILVVICLTLRSKKRDISESTEVVVFENIDTSETLTDEQVVDMVAVDEKTAVKIMEAQQHV